MPITAPTKQVQIVRVPRQELWRIAELRFLCTIVDAEPCRHGSPGEAAARYPPIMWLADPDAGMFLGIDLRIEGPTAMHASWDGVLTIEYIEDFINRARSLALSHIQNERE